MAGIARSSAAVVWLALVGTLGLATYLASTARVEPGVGGEVCAVVPPAPVVGEGAPGLLDTGGFPPRWSCGAWPDTLGWMHVASDLMVWAAYMAIPLVLFVFVRGRRDLPFPTVFWFFMAFIASCGVGHLVEASMFWWPGYRFSAVLKVGTAAVSWVTVIALVPLIPKALSLPSLERDNEELKRTLDERERMRAELERAHTKLQRHSDEMEQLIYAVSHDLKSPVFTVVSMLGLAERARAAGDEAKASALLVKVHGACDRLRGSLDALVEFGRVGHAVVEWSEVDLGALVDGALAALAGSIELAGAEVRVSGVAPVIVGDERGLKQALENLIGNAVKHGGRGGRRPTVWVRLEEGEGVVRLAVEDDGAGVPEAHRGRVFELFERLERSEVEGSGIGLALVRQVVDLHNGRVWVEDRDGGGARFVMELPLTQPVEGSV